MNIEHMRAFLEVNRTGSFQLAAEKLHVTQSTISARIKALESRLNRSLFARHRTGAELTPGGHHFHRHALTAVQAWDRAKQEIALPEDLRAMVNLGIQLNHWDQIAPMWLGWMAEHAPDIATHIVSEYSDPLMQRLRDGMIDLAVLYDPQQRADLVIEPFTSEKLVLVASEPRTLKKYRVPNYIFVDWGESFRAQHALSFPDISTPKLSVGLSAVGLSHILQYGGSGYFLEQSVQKLLETGDLHRVQGAPIFKRPTYLVFQQSPLDPQLIETAIAGLANIQSTTT